MKHYPVSEEFYSVQGEGMHWGKAAYFIRLFGCNVKCPWCDSKYAWQGTPASIRTAQEIADAASASGAAIAVITGGEPCIHNLSPLAAALGAKKIAVHIETSASVPINEEEFSFDWVAASPKLFAKTDKSAIARADEIKLILSNAEELLQYDKILENVSRAKAVWLHPEWSHYADKELLNFICETVKARGGLFRAGWQMHKNYFVR